MRGQRARLVGPLGPQAGAAAADQDEEHPAGADDDVVQARGADPGAAQEVPAGGPQIVEDGLDRDLDGSEPGDDDKPTGDAHPRAIGLPFVAH